MPIEIRASQPTICILRVAFERAGLNRVTLDAQLALTAEDFRVERDLIVIGPLLGGTLGALVAELETKGLVYFDDFFELSGNWPAWLTLFAMGTR